MLEETDMSRTAWYSNHPSVGLHGALSPCAKANSSCYTVPL